MTRIKRNVEYEKGFNCREEDLRFATPKSVADYRAKKLKCDTLLEIGAGVGFQTIAFSRTCKKVIAIEIDKERFKFLKNNLKNIKNVELINADALEIRLPEADIIFVDTERLPSEEERTLETVKPNINKILNKFKGQDICIEVPPQTRKIDLDCEKEYVSLYNKLNRLNLYFNNLKKHETSLVLLPENVSIHHLDNKIEKITDYSNYDYIYEINPAVIKSGLLAEAAENNPFKLYGNYLFSEKLIKSKFFKSFRIINNLSEYGKVILHGKIKPEEYNKIKYEIESKLEGKKVCHVFMLKDNIFAEEAY